MLQISGKDNLNLSHLKICNSIFFIPEKLPKNLSDSMKVSLQNSNPLFTNERHLLTILSSEYAFEKFKKNNATIVINNFFNLH